jgi:hypothetical protein
VTCHDPHHDAEPTRASYEDKCLACHAAPAPGRARTPPKLRPTHTADSAQGSACPVNPARDCITCHMPTVRGVIPHSPFTDHFIRVHRPGRNQD